MFEEHYLNALNTWFNEHNQWLKGEHPDQSVEDRTQIKYYAEWNGNPPDIEFFNTYYKPEECTHFQLYETTSEGTPISPVFATLEEVAEYAEGNCTTFADYTATKEQWLAMFKNDMIAHTEGNVTFI